MKRIFVAVGLMFLFSLFFSSVSALGETKKLTLDQTESPVGEIEEIGTPEVNEPSEDKAPSSLIEQEDKELGWQKPLKELTLSANYYLWSDYIFRGVNMSEYPGEGREKPVNQMDVTGEYKFTKVFGVGGKFFASWAVADNALWGNDRNIQELRYTPYLIADIEQIASRVMVGFNFFNYPNAPAGRKHDMEWYFQVCHNDAWMWKALWPDNTKGVLNPFLFVAQNIDEAEGGMAGLLGVYHPFEVPGIKYLTWNPQLSLAADHRLVGKLVADNPTTKMLFINYGMTLSYNIARALQLPPAVGDITISGNLYYSQAFADYIHDVLYGGLQVGWAW
jgi:hypothetical protein